MPKAHATFSRRVHQDGARWVATDVHPGGPAATAGLKSGDVLTAVAGKVNFRQACMKQDEVCC
ncbi:MAG: PDZ domain-containing protein [Acidobacteriaceae bacterium]|nr:PDZ domain-containing protein [Acidobacteriaceae bacterium]